MGDVDVWRFLLQPIVPAYLTLLIVGVMAWKAYPAVLARVLEGRRDREAAKSGDWSRLRAEIVRLDERCDHLQREVDECREREGVWMQRAIAAEAAMLGKGEAKQEAQRIVSAEREVDARARDVRKSSE